MPIKISAKRVKEIREETAAAGQDCGLNEARRIATKEAVTAKIDSAESFRDLREILHYLADRIL